MNRPPASVSALGSVVTLLVGFLTTVLSLAPVSCTSITGSGEGGPEILELTQGTFTAGDFPLQFERRDEPRVLALRRQEKLDDVVAGARSELEIFKRLTAWSRAQFEPGVPDPYPLSNGLAILHDIRSGKTGGFCGQYSYLLGDALKSLGYFAIRYVELESESGAGHFAVEAWCDDLDRWILLDPLNAALYEKDSLPLAAVEIHDLLLGGHADALKVKRLTLPPGHAGPRPALPRSSAGTSVPGTRPLASPPSADGGTPGVLTEGTRDADLVALFYNVAVSTRNDFAALDRPLTIQEREAIFLRYADPRVAPFRHLDFQLRSLRREDILSPMDQIAIDVRPEPGSSKLHVSFSTRGTCPHFSRYRVRIGDGPWKDEGPMLAWTLAPGENLLEARTVNAFEILGPVFRLRVRG